jgi:hypothetical protein
LIALALPAWADPPAVVERDPELLRYTQRVSPTRFQRAEDRPGRPPSVRGRGRTGPIEAWTWPDGTVARYRRYSGRQPSEDHHFDRAGIPWVTVHLARGAPERAVVHTWPEVAVPLAEWSPQVVGPIEVRGPGPAAADGRWDAPDGVLHASWIAGGAEPASAEFADGFAEGCGCVLTERTTALLDGRPGVSWRLDVPHPTAPQIGEVWAFALEEGVFVLVWHAPRSDDPVHPELAPGRAAASLLRSAPGERS